MGMIEKSVILNIKELETDIAQLELDIEKIKYEIDMKLKQITDIRKDFITGGK